MTVQLVKAAWDLMETLSYSDELRQTLENTEK